MELKSSQKSFLKNSCLDESSFLSWVITCW